MELPMLLICLSYSLSASAWPYYCRSYKPSYWSRRCHSCKTNEDINISLADGEDDYASNQEEDTNLLQLKPVATRRSNKSNDPPNYPVKPFPYPSIINRKPPNEPSPSPQNSDNTNDLPYYPVKPFSYPSTTNRKPPNDPRPSPQNSPKPCTDLHRPYPPRPQRPNDEDSTSDSTTTEPTSTETTLTEPTSIETTSTVSSTSGSTTMKSITPKRAKKHKHSKHKHGKLKPTEGYTINFSQEF